MRRELETLGRAFILLLAVILINLNAEAENKVMTDKNEALTLLKSIESIPVTQQIDVNVKVFKEIEYESIQTQKGVSGLEKKHLLVVDRETNQHLNEYRFCENQKVNISFFTNNAVNYIWKVKDSTEDILGLSSKEGNGPISFTTSNSSNNSKTMQIAVTPVFSSENLKYEGKTEVITVRVCPNLNPTFTKQPNVFDANEYKSVTYKTQANMDYYYWEIDGEQDIDYTLINGGTEKDNFAEIIWLSKGEKTVKANYTCDKRYVNNNKATNTVNVTTLGTIYEVGDEMLGGIIYKVFGTPGRQHGYIVAKDEIDNSKWSANMDFEMATLYTNGEKNTEMLSEVSGPNSAAAVCQDYAANQNNVIVNNWFLPAAGQLEEAIKALPNEFDGVYWTSTQCKIARHNALAITAEGKVSSFNKNSNEFQHKVKPVKTFSYNDQPTNIDAFINLAANSNIVKLNVEGGKAPYTLEYRINGGEIQTITTEETEVALPIAANAQGSTIEIETVKHIGDSFTYKITDAFAYIPAINNNESFSNPMAIAEEEEE